MFEKKLPTLAVLFYLNFTATLWTFLIVLYRFSVSLHELIIDCKKY